MIGFPIPPIFFVVPIDTGGEGEKVFLIPPLQAHQGTCYTENANGAEQTHNRRGGACYEKFPNHDPAQRAF